jgi:hypothetical protein
MLEEIPIVDEPVTAEPEELVTDVVTEALAPEPAPKRGRGRPTGSKGKAKPKPKKAPDPEPEPEPPKKKKAAPKKRPIQSSDSEEEVVHRKKRREPERTEDVALQVMKFLSDQHAGRATARRNKYDSWFAN